VLEDRALAGAARDPGDRRIEDRARAAFGSAGVDRRVIAAEAVLVAFTFEGCFFDFAERFRAEVFDSGLTLGSLTAVLPPIVGIFEFAKVGYSDRSFWKASRDLKRAAKPFNVSSKITNIHVGALFEFGDCRLPYPEDSCQIFLGLLPGMTQFGKRHLCFKRTSLRGRTLLAF